MRLLRVYPEESEELVSVRADCGPDIAYGCILVIGKGPVFTEVPDGELLVVGDVLFGELMFGDDVSVSARGSTGKSVLVARVIAGSVGLGSEVIFPIKLCAIKPKASRCEFFVVFVLKSESGIESVCR